MGNSFTSNKKSQEISDNSISTDVSDKIPSKVNKTKNTRRIVSQGKKNQIAGQQNYKCANSLTNNKKIGLEGYNCPLWKIQGPEQGCFDESGFEIDHIVEYTISKDSSDQNLQALCISCHRVKTKRFNSS